jgi:DNA repair exonuclease SbcCD ATPase subunit
MRVITFKSLQGKNFLSFGDEVVCVALRAGVNAIIGTNYDKEDSKNGAGKSSVTEMLYYALYGVTLREISKDFVQNSLTKKRCEVSLEFEVASNIKIDLYKITRQLNPTKCVVYKNGEDVTRSTLAKTNELIQEIIRTPATVFKNSVIMSANSATPFMALSKTDKRKFIESVLGLEAFTQMVLLAREEYNSTKKDYDIAYDRYETHSNELEFNVSQLSNYEEHKSQRSFKLTEKKNTISADIQKLKGQLAPLPESEMAAIQDSIHNQNSKLTAALEKIREIEILSNKLSVEIESENKQILKLQTNRDNCPTCSRAYSEEHTQHISDLISEHNAIISVKADNKAKLEQKGSSLKEQVTQIKEEIRALQQVEKNYQNSLTQNNSLQRSIDLLNHNLTEAQNDLSALEQEQNNALKDKVSSLTELVNEGKNNTNKLNNELNVLETVKYVLSEEGIKSFLAKKILTVLNSRIAYYLQKLEANCLCQFNEFFDEVIIDEKSQQKTYFNFSGGERKRIDLACLFAFADIRRLQGDINFSTVFYDELLDSSLDDRGVSLTLKVLRERFNENNESCYIITHRGPEVTTKAEHVIHVVKKNGISQILD